MNRLLKLMIAVQRSELELINAVSNKNTSFKKERAYKITWDTILEKLITKLVKTQFGSGYVIKDHEKSL